MASAYGEVLRPEALDPGTAVLVAGPAMCGKRELALDLLAADDRTDAATVFVTTRRAAPDVARGYEAAGGRVESLAVVDCVTRLGGFRRVTDTTDRRYVADPGDLTGTGIAVTEFLRQFDRESRTPWLGVHSLSTMLMYADVRRTFRFLHVLVGRVRATGGVAVATLETATVDDRERDVIGQPFDARIEVREGVDGREVRARGAAVAPREWTRLPGPDEFGAF
ncbi:MAG: hypothetical protein ABEJ61_00430 [Haloferacaceae archaeon]